MVMITFIGNDKEEKKKILFLSMSFLIFALHFHMDLTFPASFLSLPFLLDLYNFERSNYFIFSDSPFPPFTSKSPLTSLIFPSTSSFVFIFFIPLWPLRFERTSSIFFFFLLFLSSSLLYGCHFERWIPSLTSPFTYYHFLFLFRFHPSSSSYTFRKDYLHAVVNVAFCCFSSSSSPSPLSSYCQLHSHPFHLKK